MSEGVADICQWLAGRRGDGTTGHWSVCAVIHDVQLVSAGADVWFAKEKRCLRYS